MDGDQYVFMDMTTYEEIRLAKDETWAAFLKEGMEAGVLEWEGKVGGGGWGREGETNSHEGTHAHMHVRMNTHVHMDA